MKVQFRFIFKTLVAAVSAAILVFAAALSGCFLLGNSNTKEWVLDVIEQNYYFYDDMDKTGLEDLTVDEIVSRLDIYSEFYTSEELQALIKDNSGEKAGVGFSYTFVEAGASSVYPEGGCLIITVVGNSPAEKAGMRSGVILASGTYKGQTTEFNVNGALENFIDPIAKGVKFTLTTSSGENLEVSKEEYNASYMFMATNYSAWSPAFDSQGKVSGLTVAEGRAIEYLPDGAAYVSMSQFYGTAADEFGYLMEKFNAEGCTTLLLDLRENGGGYVDVMQDMAGYFTSSLGTGTYVAMTANYRNGRQEVYNCAKHSGNGLVSKDVELYVLANSGTASASEALIGVLISYGFLKYENVFLSDFNQEFIDWSGGDYATAQSYGKGIMQSTFRNYRTGEALKLTTARIDWPNGKCIHGVGVTAQDGCRTVKADWLVTPDDSELQEIVKIIKSQS